MTRRSLVLLGACVAVLVDTGAAQSSRPASQARIRATFRDVDVREVVQAIVMARPTNVVVHAAVTGKVSVRLDHADARAALEAVALVAHADVWSDEYGVLSILTPETAREEEFGVVVRAQSRPLAELAELLAESSGADFRAAAMEIARASALDVIVGPGLGEPPRARVNVGAGRDALRQAMPEGAVLVERGDLIRVVRRPDPTHEGLVSCSFEGVAIADAAQTLAREARQRVTVDPKVTGALTMHVRGVPWRHALTLAANAVRALVVRKEDGSFRIRPRADPQDRGDAFAGGGRFSITTETLEGLSLRSLSHVAHSLLSRPVSLDDGVDPSAETVLRVQTSSPLRFLLAIAETHELDIVELDDGGLRLAPRK